MTVSSGGPSAHTKTAVIWQGVAGIWQAIWQATGRQYGRQQQIACAHFTRNQEGIVGHRKLQLTAGLAMLQAQIPYFQQQHRQDKWQITCRVFTKGWERPVDIMGCTRLVASVFQVLPRA